MRQFLDKRRQLVRRQRSIDIAVTFCQLCREIIATQEHFQRASPPDEPWQSLRRTAARDKPDRHLWLAEDRFANGSKTHVHGERDLTPPTIVLPAKVFIDRVYSGEINDLKTLIAGYWFAKHRA
jgi:hypothetical protein